MKKTKRPPAPPPTVSNQVGRANRSQIVGEMKAKVIKTYIGPTTPAERKPTDTQLLAAFADALRPVAEQCAELVTSGIELGGCREDEPLRLAHVYVNLDTTTPRPAAERARGKRAAGALLIQKSEEPRNLSALEALLPAEPARVVLVGEPGSGKSTFLQYVTLCLADQVRTAQGLPSQIPDHDIPPLLRGRKLVPLRLLLREFAPTLDRAKSGTTDHVLAALREQFPSEVAGHLPALLKRGLALVLFDGLDEVPQRLIPRVKEAIQHFARTEYPDCRVAVTCRVASYERPEFVLEGFPRPHVIAALSDLQQEQFVRAWYAELEARQKQFKDRGKDCGDSLLLALKSEDLREMAGNPFFLTAMAALHRPDKPLPNVSARLMDQLVQSVLEESRRRRDGSAGKSATPELATLLAGIDNGLDVLRRRLQLIAYEARAQRHQRHEAASRLVDENLLRAKLALSKNVTAAWVDQLIEALRHRAGLLQCPRPDQFEFAYRFEEFLAGCHLANRNVWTGDDANFVHRARALLREQGDYARKVVQWAAGVFAHVNPDQSAVKDLVAALTPATPTTESLPDLMLAAEIAKDARMAGWQDDDVPYTGKTLTDLRERLDTVSQATDAFPVKARAAAASARGWLGELPKGVGLGQDGLPEIEWCPLPAGEFKLGETKQRVKVAAFQISRYPVTVAQYEAFLKDPAGYHREQWWRRKDVPEMLKWWKENHEQGPENYDPVFQTPNHPRVGVCWYEAAAFCRWLSARKGLDPDDPKAIRLPHEAEWEWAARWNKETGQADKGDYPWGGSVNDPDVQEQLTQHCNWHGTGLGHTSAVGLFPKGKADCGALDLSGNVWEWCGDWYDQDKDVCVVRGGSWLGVNSGRLSVSCRFDVNPDHRRQRFGFRCVVVGGVAAAG